MERLCLDKRKIIKSGLRVNEIFNSGQRAHSRHFLIFAKEAGDCKFGFTVARRLGGSVKRNRARRRLREIVRLNQEHLPANRHVIFQAKTGIERADFEKLGEEFRDLMREYKSQ